DSLAQHARDERLGAAFDLAWRAAAEQDLCRALLLGLGIEALAGGKSLAAAGRRRRGLAIGPAARRHRTALVYRHDAHIRQSDHRAGRILGGVAGLVRQLVEGLLRVLQIESEPRGAVAEPTANGVDKAGPALEIRHPGRRQIGSALALLLTWNVGGRSRFLRERGGDQQHRAPGKRRARKWREAASIDLPRTAGHPDPVPMTTQP